MIYQNAFDMLLNKACPSIQYRVRKEILGESPAAPELRSLRDGILLDPDVREIISLRREDGWIGGRFHGEREPESAIRFLTEKGVEGNHPVICAALDAIIEKGEQFDKGALERVGKHLDTFRLGGSKMIKACVFAYAGHTRHDFVEDQVAEALSGFRFVLGIDSVEQLCGLHKNSFYVFNEGMTWPSIYHLRLLAFTDSWRCPENKKMLAAAFNKMAGLAPVPEIKLLYKGQRIAPAQMDFMNDFCKGLDALSPREWMQWFHRTELTARLEIADGVQPVNEQLDRLSEYLSANGGLFTKPLSHFYFTK